MVWQERLRGGGNGASKPAAPSKGSPLPLLGAAGSWVSVQSVKVKVFVFSVVVFHVRPDVSGLLYLAGIFTFLGGVTAPWAEPAGAGGGTNSESVSIATFISPGGASSTSNVPSDLI